MPPTAEIAVEAAALRRNRRDKGARTITNDPLLARKKREDAGQFRRLCDRFVTVDNGGEPSPDTTGSRRTGYRAPVSRVHGPNRTPTGKASCNISISPTVSEV